MKVIIAGGRDFKQTNRDCDLLLRLHKLFNFTEIVSGTCKGADLFGESFAKYISVPVKQFKPDWSLGKIGGIIRNEQMAKYADALILFKGGRGSANMMGNAFKYSLKILHDDNGLIDMPNIDKS